MKRNSLCLSIYLMLIMPLTAVQLFSFGSVAYGVEKTSKEISTKDTYKIGSADILEIITWKDIEKSIHLKCLLNFSQN